MISKNFLAKNTLKSAGVLSSSNRLYQTPAKREDQVEEKFLNMKNLSPAVKNVQYAVRGKVVIRAGELEKEIKQVGF